MSKPTFSMPSPTPSPSPAPSTNSSDDPFDFSTSTLPFPAPLSRGPFSTSSFDPTTYLTDLTSRPRYQTLPDLHAELKQLSSTIGSELLDLVNAQYGEVLELGRQLQNGNERVEEVQVGVLGVKRQMEEVRGVVDLKVKEVRVLMEELKRVKNEIRVGRGLVEVERRMGVLEVDYGIGISKGNGKGGTADPGPTEGKDEVDEDETVGDGVDGGDDDDGLSLGSEDEVDERGVPLTLKKRVEDFLIIRVMIARLGDDHPFLVGQRERLGKIRQAVLVDLEETLRETETDDTRKEIVKLRISIDQEVQSKAKIR